MGVEDDRVENIVKHLNTLQVSKTCCKAAFVHGTFPKLSFRTTIGLLSLGVGQHLAQTYLSAA